MKRWCPAMVAVCAVGLTALTALCAEPTRPLPHPGGPGAPPPSSRPARSDRPDRPGPGRFDPNQIPDEDVKSAMDFLNQYSPKRAALISKLVTSNQRATWRKQVVTRWQEMKQLEVSDRKMYDIKLAQMKAEDDMFGEALASRKADGASEEHLKNLHEYGRQFVEKRNEERERLIEKLQAAIDADKADPAAAIEARVQLELNTIERGRADPIAQP